MIKKYLTYLMAPADALGGGGAAALAEESPPNSVGDFMTGLGSLEEAPAKTGDKANGDANTKPNGDTNAGSAATVGDKGGGGAGAGDAASTQDKSGNAGTANAGATNKDVNKSDAAAAAAVAGTKSGDKGGAADSKTGTTQDDEKWPRSSNDWETFKTRRAEERAKAKKEIESRDTQIAELQTQLKTVQETSGQTGKDNPEAKAEIERLTAQVNELSEAIRITDVTHHPKWKAYFGEKEKEQTDLANDILGAEKGKKFSEIVGIPDHIPALAEYKKAQMEEFLGDLTNYEQAAIANVTAELMRINRQKQVEIKKNEEHVAKLRSNRDEGLKQTSAAREKLFNGTVSQLSDPKTGLPLFQKKEGNDEWNKQIDGMISTAKRLFFGAQDLKAEEVARAAMNAAAMPRLLQAWEADLAAKDKEISTLQEQVKKLTAAQPGGARGSGEGGGTEGISGGTRQRVEPGMTPEQATANLVKQWANGME
jgi:hypothetical protein